MSEELQAEKLIGGSDVRQAVHIFVNIIVQLLHGACCMGCNLHPMFEASSGIQNLLNKN